MNNDDSFNDSDEVFNLYSSKKVIKTFKAQLKKIAASNCLTNTAPSVNDEDNFFKVDKRKTDYEIHPVEEQEDVEVVLVSKPSKILDVETPITIDVELDDSVEIISTDSSEVTPRATRQSARLRNKRSQLSRGFTQSSNINSFTPVNKRNTTTIGNKGSKKNKHNKREIIEVTLEDSTQLTEPDDELNPEVSVKVIWKSVNIKKFQMRKYQKLSYIFQQLSKEENIPEDKIMLTFNDVNVRRTDTPDSLNLQVYHFLDGGVLSESSNSCQTPKSHSSKYDSDSVTLKFQDINKKIIKINLNKKEKLKVGMIKCSEQLEVPLNTVKFYYDGELMNSSETPESLGLENEEVIDIKVF